MQPRALRPFAALGLAALCSCASTNRGLMPGADLAAVHSVYVERILPDNRGVNRVLVEDLRRRDGRWVGGGAQVLEESPDDGGIWMSAIT